MASDRDNSPIESTSGTATALDDHNGSRFTEQRARFYTTIKIQTKANPQRSVQNPPNRSVTKMSAKTKWCFAWNASIQSILSLPMLLLLITGIFCFVYHLKVTGDDADVNFSDGTQRSVRLKSEPNSSLRRLRETNSEGLDDTDSFHWYGMDVLPVMGTFALLVVGYGGLCVYCKRHKKKTSEWGNQPKRGRSLAKKIPSNKFKRTPSDRTVARTREHSQFKTANAHADPGTGKRRSLRPSRNSREAGMSQKNPARASLAAATLRASGLSSRIVDTEALENRQTEHHATTAAVVAQPSARVAVDSHRQPPSVRTTADSHRQSEYAQTYDPTPHEVKHEARCGPHNQDEHKGQPKHSEKEIEHPQEKPTQYRRASRVSGLRLDIATPNSEVNGYRSDHEHASAMPHTNAVTPQPGHGGGLDYNEEAPIAATPVANRDTWKAAFGHALPSTSRRKKFGSHNPLVEQQRKLEEQRAAREKKKVSNELQKRMQHFESGNNSPRKPSSDSPPRPSPPKTRPPSRTVGTRKEGPVPGPPSSNQSTDNGAKPPTSLNFFLQGKTPRPAGRGRGTPRARRPPNG